MTATEVEDLITSIAMAYHDQFDSNLPEEDREWNRIQFSELLGKAVDLILLAISTDVKDFR